MQIDQDNSIYILDVVLDWVYDITSDLIYTFYRNFKFKYVCTVTMFLPSYRNTSGSLGEPKIFCGNTSPRRVFPQLFRVLPNFHECFYNSIETRSACFLFLLQNNDEKKENNLLTLIIKM